MSASVIAALSSLVLLAGDAPDVLLQADLKQLEGSWAHVSTEQFGVQRTEPLAYWIFEGNRAKVHFSPRPHNVAAKDWDFRPESINHWLTYHFQLDPTQSPKALNRQTEYRNNQTLTTPQPGIYKLEGDTLTICLAGNVDKGNRPRDFTVAKESDRTILVLIRRQPGIQIPPSAPALPSAPPPKKPQASGTKSPKSQAVKKAQPKRH